MGEPNGSICKYHYAHHGEIDTNKKEIEKIQEKFEELNKNNIKLTTEVEGFERLVNSMRESVSEKFDDLIEEIAGLKKGIKDKILKIRYAALTICGISSFIAVLVIEIITWLLRKG